MTEHRRAHRVRRDRLAPGNIQKGVTRPCEPALSLQTAERLPLNSRRSQTSGKCAGAQTTPKGLPYPTEKRRDLASLGASLDVRASGNPSGVDSSFDRPPGVGDSGLFKGTPDGVAILFHAASAPRVFHAAPAPRGGRTVGSRENNRLPENMARMAMPRFSAGLGAISPDFPVAGGRNPSFNRA